MTCLSITASENSFCEHAFGTFWSSTENSYPEFLSSITAIWIALFGLLQLLTWDVNSNYVHLVASTFVVNGVASFATHWTGEPTWKLVDGLSMLFALALSPIFVVTCTWHLHRFIKKRFFNASSANDRLLRLFLWLLFPSTFWLELVGRLEGCENGIIPNYPSYLFPMMLILQVSLCIYCFQVMIHHDRKSELKWMDSGVKLRACLGTALIIIGALSWAVTETFCSPAMRFFPGHAIWHVFVVYGVHNVFYVFLFTHAFLNDIVLVYKEWKCPGGWLLDILVPRVGPKTETLKPQHELRHKKYFLDQKSEKFFSRRFPGNSISPTMPSICPIMLCSTGQFNTHSSPEDPIISTQEVTSECSTGDQQQFKEYDTRVEVIDSEA